MLLLGIGVAVAVVAAVLITLSLTSQYWSWPALWLAELWPFKPIRHCLTYWCHRTGLADIWDKRHGGSDGG